PPGSPPPPPGWDAPPPPPPGAQWSGPPPSYGTSGPSGPRASFGQRLLAAIVDGILLAIVNGVLRAILGQPGTGVGVLIDFLYFGYFEGGPAGQTVGKRVLNIRVVRGDTGGALGWSTALLRHLYSYVSALACLIGDLWMLWDKEKMTWHDHWSGTVVVPVA